MEVKIEIHTHPAFKEWEDAQKEGISFSQVMGRHQFIYKRSGSEISLIEKKGLQDNIWYWEVFCLSKPKLFEGTKRFTFKQEADNYIIRLLTPEDQL